MMKQAELYKVHVSWFEADGELAYENESMSLSDTLLAINDDECFIESIKDPAGNIVAPEKLLEMNNMKLN